jgi:hypothetical protein
MLQSKSIIPFLFMLPILSTPRHCRPDASNVQTTYRPRTDHTYRPHVQNSYRPDHTYRPRKTRPHVQTSYRPPTDPPSATSVRTDHGHIILSITGTQFHVRHCTFIVALPEEAGIPGIRLPPACLQIPPLLSLCPAAAAFGQSCLGLSVRPLLMV